MRNYYVTVTLRQGNATQEFTELFCTKKDITDDKAVRDAIRYASTLLKSNLNTDFSHLQLYKAKIGCVKKDGTINTGKTDLLWETDVLTPATNQTSVATNHPITDWPHTIVGHGINVQPTTAIPNDRITIDPTTSLNPNEIFVFGSNLSGIHGAGAALTALKSFGAIYGQGVGLQGNSYAIPTKDENVRDVLSISKIREYVNQFVEFAKANPDKKFLVTEIGCGYAKFTPEEIAPLFVELKDQVHVSFPQKFWDVLNSK